MPDEDKKFLGFWKLMTSRENVVCIKIDLSVIFVNLRMYSQNSSDINIKVRVSSKVLENVRMTF